MNLDIWTWHPVNSIRNMVLLCCKKPSFVFLVSFQTSSYGDLDELNAETMNEIYTKHDERIKLEFFKLLFDYGADVNACSEEGMTALMMIIEQV